MSRPVCRYLISTLAALPTPCLPPIAIVRTLCVATVISLLRACSLSHIALRRAALRSGLNISRFFLALCFLRSVIYSRI